jgi:succinate dehydrogenase flavin-adding protein (antitoxin of CptAB toxin-antitoxin module)
MKELDVLLLRYLDQVLVTVGPAETSHFDRFLDLPDPELARYLLAGERPADPDFAAIAAAARRTRP